MRLPYERATVALAAVLVLLVVVGASARRPLGGGASAPSVATWPLLVVVGAGLVVAAAVAAAVLWPSPRLRGGPPEGSPETGLPVRAGPLIWALALLVPLAIIVAFASPGTSGRHRTAAPAPKFGTHAPHQPRPERPAKPSADGLAALAAGVAAGVVGLAAFAVWRRARRRPGADATPRATVAAGARDARGAAAAIPADPRAAVLAAYARMEAALASTGLGRRASEAPREYLARLEAELGGGRAPAARLTELFECARFSPHPVGERLRGDALDALGRLQAELEAPA